YPDIDALFERQAAELDAKKREALLQKVQQLVHERSIYAHLWQLAFINGAGPRVGESGLGLIAGHAYSAPYEDVTLATTDRPNSDRWARAPMGACASAAWKNLLC